MTGSAAPPAWPRLLRLELAAAYCGVAPGTFRACCPVAPSELGAAVLVWDRVRLDAWLDSLPARAARRRSRGGDDVRDAFTTAPPGPPALTGAEARKADALANVRAGLARRAQRVRGAASSDPHGRVE